MKVKLEREGKQISKRIITVLGIRKTEHPYSENRDTPIRKTEHPYSENREGNNTNTNNTKREKRAHEFLKENFPSRFDALEMQNRKQVSKWADLLEGFSDKVIIEKLDWDGEVLFARLGTYIRQWRSNEAGRETAPELRRLI